MISVIINTKDRQNDLCECIKSLLIQNCPIDELIIVDASLNYDQVKESVKNLLDGSKVYLKIFHTKAGNSYQRNFGIRNLNEKADFVCFFDDDVVLYPETISLYLKKFSQWPNVDAVQGIETNRKPQHLLGKFVRRMFFIGYEGKKWELLPSGEHVMVINPDRDLYVGSFMVGLSCVRKSVLNSYLFDEWFQTYAFLEDYDFSYRISKKHKILISPEVKLVHNRSIDSRLNAFKTNKMFIINKSYFFLKNIDKSLITYLAYIWSLIGHLVLTLGKSIYTFDFGYFGGVCAGIISLVFSRPLRRLV